MPQGNRRWIAAIVLTVAIFWFAVVNLGRTGHTKIIRSGEIISDHIQDVADSVRMYVREKEGAPATEPQ